MSDPNDALTITLTSKTKATVYNKCENYKKMEKQALKGNKKKSKKVPALNYTL